MRKRIVAFLAGLVFLCVGTATFAGTVSWTLPTKYENGTAISASDQARIVVTVLVASDNVAAGTVLGTSAAGATSLSATLTPGSWYYAYATLNGLNSKPTARKLYGPPASPGSLQLR